MMVLSESRDTSRYTSTQPGTGGAVASFTSELYRVIVLAATFKYGIVTPAGDGVSTTR